MPRFVNVAHTERGLDRLVNFTDAVIAIAATLLILPIIETINDAFSDEGEFAERINLSALRQVGSFVLGFFVMTRVWREHHEIFERVKDYSRGLIALNFFWLIAMVFFAFPVGFLPQGTNEIVALYAANIAVILVILKCTKIYVLRHPELLIHPDQTVDKSFFAITFLSPALFFLIAVTSLFIGHTALALLFLLIPIRHFTRRYPLTPPLHNERGMDRIVNFSDAVIAIAITLLVLPLVDIITDDQGDAAQLVLTSPEVLAKTATFVFTFWVMSRQWLMNHRLFENIQDYSPVLIRLTFAWLLLMVLLAIPSGLIGHSLASSFTSDGDAKVELDNMFPESAFLFGTLLALIVATRALFTKYLNGHRDLLIDPAASLSIRALCYVAILFLVAGITPVLLSFSAYSEWGGWIFGLMFLLKPLAVRLAAHQDAAEHAPNKSA